MLWSYYYLDTEASFLRLFYLISIFILSITILLVSGSLLFLFIGWDLLGFSSLFLIFFYRTRTSIYSGFLAGLTNRIGDVLFLFLFGCTTFSANISFWVLALLIPISLTKSAQVPFCAWLPAAMSAPTPVSALVHSSTLVTAGVFLLVRYLFCFPSVLAYIGVLTILLGGLTAIITTDLKKIVAFSTLSQLGLLIMSFSWCSKSTIIFHLLCHGPFKALLFLCMGIGIHGCYGSQELRSSLPLYSARAFTTVFGVFSLISLCGLPFMAGGFSKHLLQGLFINTGTDLILRLCFSLGVVLTTAYCTKFLLLFCQPVSPCPTPFLPLTLCCALPLIILGFLSVVLGLVLGPNMVLPFNIMSITDGCLLLLLILFGFFGQTFFSSCVLVPSWFFELESLSKYCLLPYESRSYMSLSETSIFRLNSTHMIRSSIASLKSPFLFLLHFLFVCFVFL